MSFWQAMLRGRAQSWRLIKLTGDADDSAVVADETYVSVHLNTARLQFSRRGTKKFYGVVGSSFEIDSLDQGTSRFTAIHSADWLAEIDSSNLDRVVVSNVRILGPRPYIGGDVAFEIGLFTQLEADLAAPFIKLLTKVSDAAGVAFLSSAGPLVSILDTGIELLFGADKSALQIGAVGTLPPALAGRYALVKSDRTSTSAQLIYRDDQLFWDSGDPVKEAHLVFTVSGSRSRPDWTSIAELTSTWEDCRSAIRDGSHRRVDELLPVFRRIALTSYELLPQDAKRLAAWAEQVAKDTLQAGPTSTGGARDVPTLDSFDPFS